MDSILSAVLSSLQANSPAFWASPQGQMTINIAASYVVKAVDAAFRQRRGQTEELPPGFLTEQDAVEEAVRQLEAIAESVGRHLAGRQYSPQVVGLLQDWLAQAGPQLGRILSTMAAAEPAEVESILAARDTVRRIVVDSLEDWRAERNTGAETPLLCTDALMEELRLCAYEAIQLSCDVLPAHFSQAIIENELWREVSRHALRLDSIDATIDRAAFSLSAQIAHLHGDVGALSTQLEAVKDTSAASLSEILGVKALLRSERDAAQQREAQSQESRLKWIEHYHESFKASFKLGRYHDALRYCLKLMELHPSARTLTNLGFTYLEMERPREAYAAFADAIKSLELAGAPVPYELLQNAAAATQSLGYYDEARAYYLQLEQHYAAANPKLAIEIASGRGTVEYLSNDFEAAREFAQKAISLAEAGGFAPDAMKYMNLAMALSGLRRSDEALDLLLKCSAMVAESSPKMYSNLHVNLAIVLKRLNRPTESLIELDKAEALRQLQGLPVDPDIFLHRAMILAENCAPDDAATVAEAGQLLGEGLRLHARAKTPLHPNVFVNIGYMYIKLNQLNDALNAFDQAEILIKAHKMPPDVLLETNRAIAYSLRRDRRCACHYALRARKICMEESRAVPPVIEEILKIFACGA